jgi:uncharacterized membrane protein
MIIMALDHVRDYFHDGAFLYDPTDLEKTTPIVFFTRWITHFCAPVFMMMAGTSAFFISQRKSKRYLSIFLLKRGLWLIVLELTIINFGWDFDIAFHNFYFIVIWALGISMIALAGLIHLPWMAILITGLALVGCHNLLDGIEVTGNTLPAFGWSLLHSQQFFQWGGINFLVGYPVMPWIGVMALGYCLGALYAPGFSSRIRKQWLILIGGSAITLFVLLRLSNAYGDPAPWSQQPARLYTLLSIFNTTKYPPSLLYLMMTLGPAILFLAFTEKLSNAATRFISVYGRVPMFYYLLHIYLIHLLALLAAGLFTSYGWRIWILDQPLWFTDKLKGYGFSLGVVYSVWIGVVIGLYPLCKWYDRYKAAHKEKWWLSYL